MGFFDKIGKLLLGGNKEGEELQLEEPSNSNVEVNNDVEEDENILEESSSNCVENDAVESDIQNAEENVELEEVETADEPKTLAPENREAEKLQNSIEKESEQIEPKSEPIEEKSTPSIKKKSVGAKPQPKKENKPVKEFDDDPIQKQNKILKNILSIAQDYSVNHISVDNKALIINVSNQITFNILKNNSFADIVKREIYDQDGLIFGGGIELALKSEVNTLWTEVYSDVYVEVKDGFVADVEEKVNVIKKATIKVIANSGSLLQDIYTLDSAEIKNLPQKRYNIGIGAETLTADKQLRENQIAFDDNPSSPFFASNRYVSRAHAYIAYDESIGFLLYAEKGGTTLGGKRTRIYRDGLDIKLDNTMVPEPLHDGDVIELTKKVKLLFKLIKD